MAKSVKFDGANKYYGPPDGKEDAVLGAWAHTNGVTVTLCWEMTPEELTEIARTGKVWVSHFTGGHLFPHYIGTEDGVRDVNADYGLWRK
jgi:hypothetical protein